MELTQGLGEDKEEGVEEEEVEEAPTQAKAKKRKAKTQPVAQPKAKKVTKPIKVKPKKPITRATTRATSEKAKEEAKEKKKGTKQTGELQRKRRKYVAQPDSNEERTKLDDNSQFRMVIHPPKSAIDKLCENIRNMNLNDLKTLNFNKPSKEEQNKIEELVYAMMAKYKNTPLELDSTMPKELYKIVENKWHFCLQIEKEIRESTLARVLPDLTKGQITKANKRHNNKFSPKYSALCILQNKIQDIVNKSTQLWNSIYKATDDVYEEEYTIEARTKREETKETKEKKEEEKGEEEKKR